MHLFKNTADGKWCLWTGINWVEDIPELTAWTLIQSGVASGEIGPEVLHWLHVEVGEHVEALVQRIATAVR
jgi:hypothetical protein